MTATKSTKSTKPAKAKKNDDDVDDDYTKFEKFRDRAIKVQGKETKLVINKDPFVLGEEDGFVPEISLDKPAFRKRIAIEQALGEGDAIRLIRLLFADKIDQVLDTLERYEEETDQAAFDVLTGITGAYFEHFYGPEANTSAFTSPSI